MIEGIPIVEFAPATLLGLAIVAILFGKLVPASELKRQEDTYLRQMERMQDDHNRTVDNITHDRDEWRAAHRISETARVELSGQVEKLLEVGETTAAALHAMPRPQGGDRP